MLGNVGSSTDYINPLPKNARTRFWRRRLKAVLQAVSEQRWDKPEGKDEPQREYYLSGYWHIIQ